MILAPLPIGRETGVRPVEAVKKYHSWPTVRNGAKPARQVVAEGTRRYTRLPVDCICLGSQAGGAPPNFRWAQAILSPVDLGRRSIAPLPLGASESRPTVDRPTSVGRKPSFDASIEVGGTMYITRPGSVRSTANRLPLLQTSGREQPFLSISSELRRGVRD